MSTIQQLSNAWSRAASDDHTIDAVEMRESLKGADALNLGELVDTMYEQVRAGNRFTAAARTSAFGKTDAPLKDTNRALERLEAIITKWTSANQSIGIEAAYDGKGFEQVRNDGWNTVRDLGDGEHFARLIKPAIVAAEEPGVVAESITYQLNQAKAHLAKLGDAGPALAEQIERAMHACQLHGEGRKADATGSSYYRAAGLRTFLLDYHYGSSMVLFGEPEAEWRGGSSGRNMVGMLDDLSKDGTFSVKDAQSIIDYNEALEYEKVTRKERFFHADEVIKTTVKHRYHAEDFADLLREAGTLEVMGVDVEPGAIEKLAAFRDHIQAEGRMHERPDINAERSVKARVAPPYTPAAADGSALRGLDSFYAWPASERQAEIDGIVAELAAPEAKLEKLQAIALAAQGQILGVVRQVRAEKTDDSRVTGSSTSHSASDSEASSSYASRKIFARAAGSSSSRSVSRVDASSEEVEYTGSTYSLSPQLRSYRPVAARRMAEAFRDALAPALADFEAACAAALEVMGPDQPASNFKALLDWAATTRIEASYADGAKVTVVDRPVVARRLGANT